MILCCFRMAFLGLGSPRATRRGTQIDRQGPRDGNYRGKWHSENRKELPFDLIVYNWKCSVILKLDASGYISALPTMAAFLFHFHLFPSREQLVHHGHLPFTSKCRVKRRRTAVSVSGLLEECCPLEFIWCQRRTQAWGSGWGSSSIPDAGSLPFYSRDLQSRVSWVWIPRDSGCWMTKYACV